MNFFLNFLNGSNDGTLKYFNCGITKISCKNTHHQHNPDMERCAICLENTDETKESIIVKTNCNHIYHLECFDLLLKHHIISCPLCRTHVKSIEIIGYFTCLVQNYRELENIKPIVNNEDEDDRNIPEDKDKKKINLNIVQVYARSYDVLRIMSGMSELRYAS